MAKLIMVLWDIVFFLLPFTACNLVQMISQSLEVHIYKPALQRFI